MKTGRELRRDEVEHVSEIDRSEMVENIYRLENGALVLKPHHFDIPGWPPGEAERYTPILLDCFDRGGWFYGAFDGAELIGVAVVESKRIGKDKDQLQLKFLHVSRSRRNTGLGKQLFELARTTARARGRNDGSPGRIRTSDMTVNSRPLYRLSYRGVFYWARSCTAWELLSIYAQQCEIKRPHARPRRHYSGISRLRIKPNCRPSKMTPSPAPWLRAAPCPAPRPSPSPSRR